MIINYESCGRYEFSPILIRAIHSHAIVTIIVWSNISHYTVAPRDTMRFKSNSPGCILQNVTCIQFTISYRNDSVLVQSWWWRYLFWLPALSLLPCGMRCAIVTSAEHFQWTSDHIANPRLDTWHSDSVYGSISFITFCSYYLFLLLWNLTYYEPNISLVTQHAVVLCPVIKNYTAYRDKAYQAYYQTLQVLPMK